MKRYLLLSLLCGSIAVQAGDVNTANFTSVSAENKAAATSVTLTGTLTTSGNSDFRQLRDLAWQMQTLNLEQANCPSIPNNALHSRYQLQTLKLPRAVKYIGTQAFFKCSGLKGTLTIPLTTVTIGYAAFADCSSLEGLSFLGKTVSYIGSYAFANCSSLRGTLTLPEGLNTLRSGTFQNCSSLEGLSLPSSLQEIQDAAFAHCSSLSGTVDFGRNIAIIGASAFEGCTGLNEPLVLPRAIQSIGASAFRGCTHITGRLNLPSTLTSLGEGAFADCATISTLEISKQLPLIPAEAFKGCKGLTQVTVSTMTPQAIDATAFDGVNQSECTLLVPSGSESKYAAADVWKNFKIKIYTSINNKKKIIPFVTARDGNIYVTGAEIGTPLSLYSASGQIIRTLTLENSTFESALPAKGIYLVKLGDKEYKIRN